MVGEYGYGSVNRHRDEGNSKIIIEDYKSYKSIGRETEGEWDSNKEAHKNQIEGVDVKKEQHSD